MDTVGEKEDHSQKRIVPLFQEALAYTYRRNGRNSIHQNCNLVPQRPADWLKNSHIAALHTPADRHKQH